ncbi:hypothetical protein NRIC_11680 [Enterococcus florum]|uniref:DUF3089 domain-containing protein n=1 Tax=Enterococcus florum TaxID=2480627 RepID=A0A4P5P5X1_9ENTE|nr:DUF3089 domain-containing protein [Enterococcus florum]GCF93277.1 hypothetical protein NRIC_11680 [Enterococcus florum]
MKKIMIGSIIGLFVLSLLGACSQKEKSKETKRSASLEQPAKAGDEIEAADYHDVDNWIEKTTDPTEPADVFMLYPTAYQRKKEQSPVSTMDNINVRAGAQVFLANQGSAFESSGNVFMPMYRQFDANWLLSQPKEQQAEYTNGIPKADVLAAFDYYIQNYNEGRPFILVGHSQGAALIKEILFDYLKEHPEVNQRMIAAYVIGQAVTRPELAANPHTKFATGPDDTGVIISYNTVSPDFNGELVTNAPEAMAINPISWTTDETTAPAETNLGSYVRNEGGTYGKVMGLADARIDAARGLVICSTAEPAKYAMPESTRKIFPEGSFHNNDISFYYYNLQQNAENRVFRYLAEHTEVPVENTPETPQP